MPLSTLAATITSNGISAPTFAQIFQSLQDSFRAIYGADAYISPDSQDGQLLAVIAKAIDDTNQMAIATYNAFSPSFAQGVGLSSVIRINGITRQAATFSTAIGDVGGVAGTVITAGSVKDNNGNLWNLPAEVIIPGAGTISVTVTAQEFGAITAAAGTIDTINTPVFGWQTFVSTTDSIAGVPIESDAELRRRQLTAAALPSTSPMAGLQAALENLAGVTRAQVYENVTNAVDANGLAAHSIAAVIEGGDVVDIAQTIGQKKTPGAALNGTTTQNYTDPVTQLVYAIKFYPLQLQVIAIAITVAAGTNYSSTIGDKIKASISSYIKTLGIGEDLQWSRLWSAAYLNGDPDNQTYEVTVLQANGGTADVVVPFNKAANTEVANVALTVI